VALSGGRPLAVQTSAAVSKADVRLYGSRSPSSAQRTTGTTCFGKIAVVGSNKPARLCETRKNRATASRPTATYSIAT